MVKHTTFNKRKKGFSLVELLAAMAVLAMLVALLAKTFSGTANIYTSSFSRSDQNAVMRAAMSFITKELQTAVCDDVIGLQIKAGNRSGAQYTIDGGISFLSTGQGLGGDTSAVQKRSTRIVLYRVEPAPVKRRQGRIDPAHYDRYQLVRYMSNDFDVVNEAYTLAAQNQTWNADVSSPFGGAERGILIDNIAAFEIIPFDFEGNRISVGGSGFEPVHGSANYIDDGVAYLDVYVELLGKEQAAFATKDHNDAEGNSISTEDYVAQNSNRYFSRVYLPNALGHHIFPSF